MAATTPPPPPPPSPPAPKMHTQIAINLPPPTPPPPPPKMKTQIQINPPPPKMQTQIQIKPPLPPPTPPPQTQTQIELSPPPPPKSQTQIKLTPPPPPPPKMQTHIEINPPRFSIEFTAEEIEKEQRIPFPIFRPLSQRKNTWIISLFVFIHLIAFAATMIVNDCWQNSQTQCALKSLGRFSFQPLRENPLLGPSASTLTEMGALQRTDLTEHHLSWRLFTSLWLHAGVFHLIVNISSIIFVGIHLEQEFGSLRTGIIYIISAFFGSLVAALFPQYRPSVASSGALFGLLGAMMSILIGNWKFYTKKFAALVAFFTILMMNLTLGLIPFVNNFSNVGGFISGFFVGFVFLVKPQVCKTPQLKCGLFEYDIKRSVKLRLKLDRLVLRSISLLVISLLIAGVTIAVLRGTNVNKYCGWCRYMDCVPLKWWSCSDKVMNCETMVSSEHLTLTCPDNGNFRSFPFANISQARMEDLCYLICS